MRDPVPRSISLAHVHRQRSASTQTRSCRSHTRSKYTYTNAHERAFAETRVQAHDLGPAPVHTLPRPARRSPLTLPSVRRALASPRAPVSKLTLSSLHAMLLPPLGPPLSRVHWRRWRGEGRPRFAPSVWRDYDGARLREAPPLPPPPAQLPAAGHGAAQGRPCASGGSVELVARPRSCNLGRDCLYVDSSVLSHTVTSFLII